MAKVLSAFYLLLIASSAQAEVRPAQTFCFLHANCQGYPLPVVGDTMEACQRYLDRFASKIKAPLIRGSWSIRTACYDVYGDAANVVSMPRRGERTRARKNRRGAPGTHPERGGGCAPGYYQDPMNPQQCRPDIADGRYRNGNGQVCRNEPDSQGGYVWVCR